MLTRKDSDSYITNLQVDDALADVSTEFSSILPRTNRIRAYQLAIG